MVVEVVVVVVSDEPWPDVLNTQLWAEPELDVQLTVDPALKVLLVHAGALPSVAVQLSLELLLDALDPELLLLALEVQVVVVPLPDVTIVHPAGRLDKVGALPELLEFDDPPLLDPDDLPLLKLDDPPPLELDELPLLKLLELNELPLLERDEIPPELAELLLVELYEPSLPDTEPTCARATWVDRAEPRPAGSAIAPARSSSAAGKAIARVGKNFMRYLASEPFRVSVKTH